MILDPACLSAFWSDSTLRQSSTVVHMGFSMRRCAEVRASAAEMISKCEKFGVATIIASTLNTSLYMSLESAAGERVCTPAWHESLPCSAGTGE